jgi:hypothetical protein
LGLPRLKAKTKPNTAAPLAPEKFDVDELALPAGTKSDDGIRSIERESLKIVELDSTREWTSLLGKGRKEPQYVSFLVYGSDSTVIAINGAWVGIAQSSVRGCLQLMIGQGDSGGIKWREAGIHIPQHIYGGAQMAQLPVLTIRFDPKGDVWDLYTESVQVADGIPLDKTGMNAGKFLVRAGKSKAWICGIVQSDENPLFDDVNANGIDDEFERTKKGALLPENLAAGERASLAKEARVFVQAHPSEAWYLNKPRPD